MDTASIRRELRRRNFFRVGMVVGFFTFLGVAALAFLVASPDQPLSGMVTSFMFLDWFYIVASSLYLVIAPCPRCGKKFWYNEQTTFRSTVTDKCLNCGLRIDGSNLEAHAI